MSRLLLGRRRGAYGVLGGGGGGSYPNEPNGYVAFAHHHFNAIPSGTNGVLGSWYNTEPDADTNIEADATSPTGEGNVVVVRYPNGLSGGDAPCNFGYSDLVSLKKEFYFSYWVKVDGTDYEQQSVGTKVGFFGINGSGARNDTYMFFGGTGTQQTVTDGRLEIRQQNAVNRNLLQNLDATKYFTVGSWHQVEFQAVLNLDPAVADGVCKMWIDGHFVTHYTDVQWRAPTATSYFGEWKFSPTWGGIGGTRTRDDFLRIDEVYISGVDV